MCADALVRAIERRQRRVFVPRSLAFFALLRQLLVTAPFDLVLRRAGLSGVPDLERDAHVQVLGRAFGSHSVETARATPPPPDQRP